MANKFLTSDLKISRNKSANKFVRTFSLEWWNDNDDLNDNL